MATRSVIFAQKNKADVWWHDYRLRMICTQAGLNFSSNRDNQKLRTLHLVEYIFQT